MIKGMGGAMDLVAGVRKVIVTMEHVARDGASKFVQTCSLPLTGQNVVDMLITDLAVVERPAKGEAFVLRELSPGVSVQDLHSCTGAHFEC
jgi:3-oxoacid CoA-transferase subunit B